MRDLRLLAFTLLAMRRLGDDGAQMVREGRSSPTWYAGSQPLNGQAVRDLLNDGWLRVMAGSSHQVRIDAWPISRPWNCRARSSRQPEKPHE